MFKHYESDQERKRRELEKNQPKEIKTGPARSRGYGGGNRSSFVFRLKNSTIYLPMNTMWIKFRSTAGTNNIPDPRLSGLQIKVADIERMEPALQQARNVLMHTHHGIEDFEFKLSATPRVEMAGPIRQFREQFAALKPEFGTVVSLATTSRPLSNDTRLLPFAEFLTEVVSKGMSF
jgi:hypothetical protein